MPNRMIVKKSTITLAVIFSLALAWGAQNKGSASQASKPAAGSGRSSRTQETHHTQETRGTQKTQSTQKTQRTEKTQCTEKTQQKNGPDRLRPSTQTIQLKDGGTAQLNRRADGRVADIHANGMAIHEGVHGGRTIKFEDSTRAIVSNGPRSGYVQRPYFRNGRAYIQRTYVLGGHSYARVYREYTYGRFHYYRYVPAYYYHRGFYGWACGPWRSRVYYTWGWGPAPWFYGGYFAPVAYYPSASWWLTDYLFAANLQAAYQAGVEAGQASGATPAADASQTPLSPEVKQQIANEMKQQLESEQAAAANPQAAPSSTQAPEALDPAQSIFVVSSNLSVATPDGPECNLTPGDVIDRIDDKPRADNDLQVKVISSKQNDCSVGAKPMVALEDLQEMHNSFREQLDSGLQTLAAKSGTGGLPNAPDTETVRGEVHAPERDRDAANQLQAQQKQANEIEAQVQQAPHTNQ